MPKNSVAFVPAHSTVQRTGEVTYPFRQNNYFYYLTGLNEPNLVLVLASNGSEIILTPNYSAFELLWEVGVNSDQITKISGIKDIAIKKNFSKLSKLINTSTKILSVPTSPKRHLMPLSNPGLATNIKWIKRNWPTKKIGDARIELVHMRMIKHPDEVKMIQRAIDATARGLKAVQTEITPGTAEAELDRLLRTEFLRAGADEVGFENIVSAGKNACTIHYQAKHSVCKKGELVLFDVGAEVQNYSADITRVYSVGSTFNTRQQDIYNAVKEVQSGAMKLLRPGVQIKEYEQQVEQIMGKALAQLGLITRPARKKIRYYFPHATSHHLGLDVHDVADYREPLSENMILTVEPGIYIPEEGIGVRLEDDVLVTKNGIKNLSAGIPK